MATYEETLTPAWKSYEYTVWDARSRWYDPVRLARREYDASYQAALAAQGNEPQPIAQAAARRETAALWQAGCDMLARADREYFAEQTAAEAAYRTAKAATDA